MTRKKCESHFVAKLVIHLFCMSLAFFVHASSAEPEWITVTDRDLRIQAGSALDFSKLPGLQQFDASKPIVIDNEGQLRISGSDEIPRFHCASLALSPIAGGYPKAGKAAAEYAAQLKRHGYNLVRFHYVDATLMTNRYRDFDFDPVQLKNFMSLLAALKQEGIYWIMDGMTSENGAIGVVYPHRWINKYNLKTRIYYDPVAQEHWKLLIKKLLGLVNPYTGIKIIEDPALLGIITVNEGGVNYLATINGAWPSKLKSGFNLWLNQHYSSQEEIAAAWPDLAADERLVKQNIRMPSSLRDASPRMADFQRYIAELESSTNAWMTTYLRSLNFKGMISAQDNWLSSGADAARGSLDWVDMHNYQDIALSFEPGAKIEQSSTIDGAASYIGYLAAARQLGKPFSVTEYGQPFWNRYRFESGIIPPAVSRLQGWNFICQHAEGAIDTSYNLPYPRKQALFPYGIGLDPVTRAGETLAALIIARGDVAVAPNQIIYKQSQTDEFSGSGVGVAGRDITTLALLTKLGTIVGDVSDTRYGSTLVLSPDGKSSSIIDKAIARLTGSPDDRLEKTITLLKQGSVLAKTNSTSQSHGIYESETGEMILDQDGGTFKLLTLKTEAIATNLAGNNFNLSALSVSSISTPGLLAASALDNLPLATSRKILLILASDAQNTGMVFADSERKELVNLGTLPVQLLHSVADVSIQVAGGKYKLYSLHLNGAKGDEIPVRATKGGVHFTLDNGYFRHGPTTFFLLEGVDNE